MRMTRFSPALQSFFAMICIALVGSLVYANTYQVPWYFDDMPAIVENQSIRDCQQTLLSFMSSGRGIAALTFALNYHFGGLDVFGYHFVNIGIHLLTACVVFLLLKRVFQSPLLLPWLGSLLFLLHPLQTQSVTYIVQRMTSLAGLFFFLAIYLFVRAKEEVDFAGRFYSRSWAFYLTSLLCGAFAVLTKQNAAVLPIAILLFDRYFLFQGKTWEWKRILPFFIVPTWVAFKDLALPMAGGKSMAMVSSMQTLVSQDNITPLKYLVTEFSVVWLYIRLLFLPYSQALDYGYPVVTSVFVWSNLWPLLGILALLWLAFSLRKSRPLISFGILWFFLALLVESTIIPLDPVFEHRLYVPMFGFVLVLIDILRGLLQPRQLTAVLLAVVLFVGLLTWNRNALWNDPVAFYEDNLLHAPNSERVAVGLAINYVENGQSDSAREVLERAVVLNPKYDQLYVILAKIYIEGGQFDQAMQALQNGLAVAPYSKTLLNKLGVLYDLLGQAQLAIQTLDKALSVEPEFPLTYLNLGVVYAGLERWVDAVGSYRKAIDLSYEYPLAHFNLGVVYYNKKDLPAAQEQFRVAVTQDPENAEALFNLASVALELGDSGTAVTLLPRLRFLNQDLARELGSEVRASNQ